MLYVTVGLETVRKKLRRRGGEIHRNRTDHCEHQRAQRIWYCEAGATNLFGLLLQMLLARLIGATLIFEAWPEGFLKMGRSRSMSVAMRDRSQDVSRTSLSRIWPVRLSGVWLTVLSHCTWLHTTVIFTSPNMRAKHWRSCNILSPSTPSVFGAWRRRNNRRPQRV